MARPTVSRYPADQIAVRRRALASIAVVGNPNAGKSTLFNRLTGMRQKTANYPGVTVERHVGTVQAGSTAYELVDLPGTFALSAHSLEERIAVDVILGKVDGTSPPAAVLAVISATQLQQGLYLLSQLSTLNLPVAVALTMNDAAQMAGVTVDLDKLAVELPGIEIYPVVATTGEGIEALTAGLAELPNKPPPSLPDFWPELAEAVNTLLADLPEGFSRTEIERAMVDVDSEIAEGLTIALGPDGAHKLRAARAVFGQEPPLAAEARRRHQWAGRIVADVRRHTPRTMTWARRAAAWLNKPLPGTIGLFVVMALVFQAVFAWATPMMDLIDGTAGALGAWVIATLPEGAVASFIADGVIAGVGSVVVFLPQIVILFLFIIFLEDTGYLARAAYLMDRGMSAVGLSGQSIIPMISSFACAVPGIMATRVIPNRRDRIATILAAPFMTCSARLPVYALLIAAFVPQESVGPFNLQGVVLLGLYLLGIVAGLLTALALRKTALQGPKPPFALMLPEFRRPNARTVFMQLLGRVKVFLRRAGTVIFSVAVIVWALAYFPHPEELGAQTAEQRAALTQTLSGEQLEQAIEELENEAAARQLEQSYLGRMGLFVEPVFRPLGWDWKVSAAVIAGFPAREVVVAVLGTIYAVGDEAEADSLTERLQSATWPDGTAVFTLPMVIGLLIFYACCLQCAATLAVIRRETNSWRWPIFAWAYMTGLGYLGALLAFQLGTA